MSKVCQVCNQEKPITEFYKHPVSKSIEYRCRECKLRAARLDAQRKRIAKEFRKKQASLVVYGNE